MDSYLFIHPSLLPISSIRTYPSSIYLSPIRSSTFLHLSMRPNLPVTNLSLIDICLPTYLNSQGAGCSHAPHVVKHSCVQRTLR